MNEYPEDIYTEPTDFDIRTLANLGPLTGIAGIWQGTRGLDVKPKADAANVKAPLIAECHANLECRLVEFLKRYDFFIFEVVKAHAPTAPK